MTTIDVETMLSVHSFKVSERIARSGVIDLGATNTINTANALGGALRFQKTYDVTLQITRLLDASNGRAIAAVVLTQDGEVLAEVTREGANRAALKMTARTGLQQSQQAAGNNSLDIAVRVVFGPESGQVGI
ncbi:hypothetical protein [Yoonia sp.]|jgi:hypothetical protein|uniref:hypothetical protein n=1 Tax=Yoonia sp. TaxID=2212373 RepID=UPI0025CC3B4A|nr:hypothetical protein [Yoonia sp.]